MRSVGLCLVLVAGLGGSAWGQPRTWVDDFKTAATYDTNSLYAPCSGGPAPKYTLLEGLLGDIYGQRAYAGDGSFSFNTRSTNVLTPAVGRKDFAVIGWYGVGIVCPGGPPLAESTEPFTSGDICIYGAIKYNPWQTKFQKPNGWDVRGTDGQPGVAGVDDDQDGQTDDWDETPAARPTTVNGGFGNKNGTGFKAGLDAAPGVAGVDDDANGIVDDVGETGWAGSDDGDDTQRHILWMCMKTSVEDVKLIYLGFDPGSSLDAFSFRQIQGAAWPMVLEWPDEISPYNYYQAAIKYNWVFCVAGHHCYGAQLWHEADMSNPVETLGPLTNTEHTGPNDKLVCVGYDGFGGASNPLPVQFKRQQRILGNSNFSDTFWVISGSVASHYPSPSADLDADKDVDGFDFLTFSNCYNGSNKAPLAACANVRADLDDDGDVDGFDFLTFSNCYNGSNRKPLAACFSPNLTNCGS